MTHGTRGGQRAVFEDAVRRTGGIAGDEAAGTQLVNVKQEPATESPDLIVLSPAKDVKGELAARDGEGGATRGNYAPNNAFYNAFYRNEAAARWPGMMQAQAWSGEHEECSVVITNVNFQATPEQLGLFFDSQCGSVVRVTILKNAHGFPKGYAYMELENGEAAQSAMNMTGVEFMGRVIKVRTNTLSADGKCFPARLLPRLLNALVGCGGGNQACPVWALH